VLVAYQAGDAADRDFWHRTIEATEQTDADLDRALHLMESCGAIRATLDHAAVFIVAAKAALAAFPDSTLQRALLDVADYTVSRAC
jgi:octaprenyl-diphosphate synthase